MTTKKSVRKSKKLKKAGLHHGKRLSKQRTLVGPIDGHTFR